MLNKKSFILIGLSVGLVVSLLFLVQRNKPDKVLSETTTANEVSPSQAPSIKVNCAPQENPDLQKAIINDIIQGIITEFKSEIGAVDPAHPEDADKNWLTIDCQTVRSDDELFSVKFNISAYGYGAAHPVSYVKTFNYSLRNNKELGLSDLFKDKSDYLEKLSALSRQHLKASLKDGYFQTMVEDGTSPNDEKFKGFLVEKDGLTIIFDQGQVSSNADGIQQIKILSSELEPIYLF
ncbi:MAG: Peptidoglycan-N-acetylmuramic acid deacetylase PdaC [Microgenomates group bacterium ADurb.Bin238]|nr:MAG: Peptidoglycan-N-acetylmuramic acid deacetylase PdaC [Microgenomates group bacterium ADurb.Bin238]